MNEVDTEHFVEYNPWLVDIPTEKILEGDESPWVNVGSFSTKKEAVDWIRKNVGNCDDNGNISLVSFCPGVHSEI